ncbi:MAG: tetratricopeptide repeat protein [Candidatus Electrothrix aestuarii]|uniref:Tetratricopeptide repeat protein n=1 Tax=Candidatus Electrothrix aestuarii TaxID=3062594 RepID=A0AAU8LXU8_9BACT|nr:tetratricopeptide repeat protein [Candidatus Electrothrix aestuarii]
MTDNTFESKGSDQNVAQGDGAVGKQENVGQEVDGDGSIFSGTGNVTVNKHYGISEERFEELRDHLSITDLALRNFFKILEEQQIPRDDLDAKLREIAATHKDLLTRLATVQSEDPEVQRLKQEAKQAIEAGEYDKAEELLNQAEALDLKAIEKMEKTAKQRRISAATTNAEQAKLQEVQLRYAKAAEYWQKAAALLPEGENKDQAYYLGEAGYDLLRISRYSEALRMYEQGLAISQEIGDKKVEGTTLSSTGAIHQAQGDYDLALTYLEQSLAIRQEIGDRAGEGTTLNNISQIYRAWGDYTTALKYLEQSLAIRQEISDRAGEGTTLSNMGAIHHAQGGYDKALHLFKQSVAIFREAGSKAEEGTLLNNISQIYKARGDYDTALKYLEQSLAIRQEIGDRAGEGTTLNNISQIYHDRGDYDTALKYLKQSLEIMEEIGAKMEEAVISWNIGHIYKDQGDLTRAEQYMARTVEIEEAIGLPTLEESRNALAELRAALPQE